MRFITACSAILFCITLLLIAIRPQYSFAPEFHARVSYHWTIANPLLHFCNQNEVCPCFNAQVLAGSLDDDSFFIIPFVCYYRYVEARGISNWSFSINLWCHAAFFAALPGIWLWEEWRKRREELLDD